MIFGKYSSLAVPPSGGIERALSFRLKAELQAKATALVCGATALAGMLVSSHAEAARLTLAQSASEIVVTSSAAPTWRLVIAVNPQATTAAPGGGTVRALHVPADNEESIVGPDPGQFCCAGWGLDNLEWRYVENNRGVRAPLGTTATIQSLEILKQTPEEIVIKIQGEWKNVPRFTRTIEINPRGFHVRLEADWAGPTDKRGMWWLISLFRSSRVDNGSITIKDADTAPVILPAAKEGVFPLPDGIEFPYEVSFPIKRQPGRALKLRVSSFGTDQPAGRRYELWPEENGFVMFYPRWVHRNFEQRRYIFDYAWTIDFSNP